MGVGVGGAAPWLSTMFTTVLPSEVTAHVFDALLLEGNEVGLLCLFGRRQGGTRANM